MKAKNIFLLILLASFCNAQISGYMGKRFSVGYSNYFFPGLKGPGASDASAQHEFSPAFNAVHNLNIEYVKSNRKMLCASAQYMKTGIAYYKEHYDDSFFGFFYDATYPNNLDYRGTFSKPAVLTSINYAIGLKTYRKGFIAPIGKYQKIDFILLFEKVKYDNARFYDQYTDTLVKSSAVGTGEYNYTNFSIAYTLGKSKMISNVIILDYGIRFAYAPAINVGTVLFSDAIATDMQGYYRSRSDMRIFRQQLINFHLGISFLAF